MKFSLQTTNASARQIGSMELIDAIEGLSQSWMDLTEAQRNMNEVCDVMDNIQMSIESLAELGDSAVPVLNVDKSLESLLQLPEKLITAEKAQEGLGEAARKAWETLKEWCKKIWEAIRNAFSWIMQKVGSLFSNAGEAFDKLSKMSAAEKKALEETPIKKTKKSTEGLSYSLEGSSDISKIASGYGIISYKDFTTLYMGQYNLVQNLLERCYYAYLVRKENIDKVMQDIDSGKTTVAEYIKHLKESIEDLVKDVNSKCGKFYQINEGISTFDYRVEWAYNMASDVNNISGDPKLKDIGWTASHIAEVMRPGYLNELNKRSTKESSENFNKFFSETYAALDKIEDKRFEESDDTRRLVIFATVRYYKCSLNLFSQFAKHNIKVTSLLAQTIAKISGQILSAKVGPMIRDAINSGNVSYHKL